MNIKDTFTNIAPATAQWITNIFAQVEPDTLSVWYNAILLLIIIAIAFVIASYQKRYAVTLFLTYASGWILNKPYKDGLLSFNFANTLDTIKEPGGLLVGLQLMVGLVIAFNLILFIWRHFVVYPLKYKARQHEGSAYRKRAERDQIKANRKRNKQQKNNAPKNTKTKPSKKNQKNDPIPDSNSPYDSDKGNESDVDFYL